MLHKASDLSSEQKVAIESLLGREIADEETISVRAFEPAPLPDEQRHQIVSELDAYFARLDAKRPALPEAEAEDILNEALRSTRPHYRSVR